MARLIARDFQ
jgi:hypothetical protein